MSRLMRIQQSSFMWLSAVAVLAGSMAFGPYLFGQPGEPLLGRRQRTLDDFPNGFNGLGVQALPSIVAIEAWGPGRTVVNCRDPWPMHARGTGFVVDPGNAILTSSRLVAGADRVRVRTRDGFDYWATSAGIDPMTDLAVLRVGPDISLPVLPLADSDVALPGDWVLAVGQPAVGRPLSDINLSAGIISGRGPMPDSAWHSDYLQTDAMINSGNFGGPLLNLNGQVVGINTMADEFSAGGPGYAIPANQINWVARELIDRRAVRRGFLGVATQALSPPLARQFQVPAEQRGVLVSRVTPNSPAAAGKVLNGDVIVALDRRGIVSPNQLHSIVERLEPGKSYPMEVIRDGARTNLSVVPTAHVYPAKWAPRHVQLNTDPIVTPLPANLRELGLTTTPMTPELAKRWGYPADTTGLVIDAVEPGSLAAQERLRSGLIVDQVGKRTIATTGDWDEADKQPITREGVLLRVRTPRETKYVLVGDQL